MLDADKIARFISEKRRNLKLTQQQLAEKMNISYQAVSKWETGAAYPNIELLYELALLFGVTVDEILKGREGDGAENEITYSKSGVDITYTDSIKSDMAKHLETADARVLNKIGAFASLYDFKFDDIENPVLVLKAEEPGSKQKLAIQYGYMESICHDMINHLVNDIIVMGAKPLAVLDTIICGSAEKDTIAAIIKGISEACRNNSCSLVGGETSIQPSVVEKGIYVLTSSIAGIVDRDAVIDGAKISDGDSIIAVSSNGLHTNGYSLVRMMMDQMPEIMRETVAGEDFMSAIMKPHLSYNRAVTDMLTARPGAVTGMAHITGGGIKGNLSRIIPAGLTANIDLAEVRVLPIFKLVKSNGAISDAEMLRTFNCGVGLIVVVKREMCDDILARISKYHNCYVAGEVSQCGDDGDNVRFLSNLDWQRR